MKKFMFAAMAALAITSCSQNEELEAPSGKKEIGFTSVVGKSSRAAEMDLTLLKTKHFKVYSYNTGTSLYGTGVLNKLIMEGVEVRFVDPNWTYTGTFYWPLDEAKVQFFAYAPSESTAVYSVTTPASDTNPIITYTIPAVVDQEDFVVAKATDQTSTTGNVALKFNHALTQVNFSIKGEDGFTYTVTNIKISGVANKGTFSFSDFTSWTVIPGTTAEYEYSIGSTNSVTGTTAIPLDQTGNALMLLPQSFALESVAVLKVSYTVTDTHGNSIYKATDKEIKLANTKAWSAGKKMRYTLTLTNNPKAITFDVPEFEPWGEEEDESGNVPKG